MMISARDASASEKVLVFINSVALRATKMQFYIIIWLVEYGDQNMQEHMKLTFNIFKLSTSPATFKAQRGKCASFVHFGRSGRVIRVPMDRVSILCTQPHIRWVCVH